MEKPASKTTVAKKRGCRCSCPFRLITGLMLFMALFVMYMMRADFSMNMLAMVNEYTANGTLIEKPNVSLSPQDAQKQFV